MLSPFDAGPEVEAVSRAAISSKLSRSTETLSGGRSACRRRRQGRRSTSRKWHTAGVERVRSYELVAAPRSVRRRSPVTSVAAPRRALTRRRRSLDGAIEAARQPGVALVAALPDQRCHLVGADIDLPAASDPPSHVSSVGRARSRRTTSRMESQTVIERSAARTLTCSWRSSGTFLIWMLPTA